jgi:hypothetical protein
MVEKKMPETEVSGIEWAGDYDSTAGRTGHPSMARSG